MVTDGVYPEKTASSRTDANYVQEVLRGNSDAYQHLYVQHRKKILAICLGFTRNHAQASDLTQDVFLRAYKRLSQLKEPEKFLHWLSEIARNECLSYIRKQQTLQRALRDYDVVREIILENKPEWTDSEIELVKELIAGLDNQELRETVELFYIEGKKVPEISELQGVTQSLVTTRLNRFRARYRKQIMIEILKRRGHGDEL